MEEREFTQAGQVQTYMRDLQDRLCGWLEALDGRARFREDSWERVEGGGGRTRILMDGAVFERGGVNFSAIQGQELPQSASAHRQELAGLPFTAQGVSLVLHPWNPYVPTVHMNLRYFEAGEKWWFGGGADLTPYYGVREDAQHFHRTLKAACDRFDPSYYPRFKEWCDRYFYIRHRQEGRGIGGIFFDDLNDGWETTFGFVCAVGEAFWDAYSPLVKARCDQPYGQREREFQLMRRGRYVEFNLVYDRGTLFGLQSGGRVESILMSMPPLAAWRYSWEPEPGSPEADLYEVFLQPQDWIGEAEQGDRGMERRS